jgi:hypothetical protein
MNYFKLLIILVLILAPVSDLMATSIDITSASLTRTVRGPNSIGWSPGDRILVDAVLNKAQFDGAGGYKDTTMAGKAPNGSVIELSYDDYFTVPHYNRTVGYSTDKLTPWTLTVTNGTDKITKNTNSLVGVDTIPYVRNVQLQGAGLEPTIRWTLSGNLSNKRVQVYLHDAMGKRFWVNGSSISASINSITIPNGELEDGKKYTARIKVFEKDPNTGLPLSQTETFIDFTPLVNGDPNSVFLPTVGIDSNTGDDLGASYYFDVDVTASTPIFIDPAIAVGYEYQIGSGDPLFESVTLPSLGDNNYQLWLYNGSGWSYSTDIAANSQFFLAEGE